ncbi:MAG: 16S rRNA (guanine(966)-N(2))-methyltransferase RsmD [Bryobacteraceae bacterium]
MRVIAGEFRSRRLKSPPGLETRPTPDRLRESLFSILMPVLSGAVFADAYAGTGSVGIEALSRGAAQAVFIERNRANCGLIRENLQSLDALARGRIIHGAAATYLPGVKADIYFLDPPYDRPAEYNGAMLAAAEAAGEDSIVIAQHASRHALDESYGTLKRYRVVRQGDNSLSFYRTMTKDAESENTHS